MPLQPQKQKVNRRLIIVLSSIIVILAGALVFAVVYFTAVQQAQNKVLLQIHTDTTQKTKETQQMLLAQWQELEKTQGVITTLARKQISLEQKQNNVIGLAQMVNRWTPLMAKITCKFEIANPQDQKWKQIGIRPETEYLSGSGFVMSLSGSLSSAPYIAVITNKHVLRGHNGFSSAKECVVEINDDRYLVKEGENIQDTLASSNDTVEYIDQQYYLLPGLDAGFIILQNAKMSLIQKTQSAFVCGDTPKIGDEIVVLGFPAVGSDESITATEGIISGIEGDYFVTSAKIEQGNSGGAAFLIKDNCYFGIPTFVKSGTLESLARILSVRAFLGR